MTELMSMHTHMLIKGIVSYALNRAKTGLSSHENPIKEQLYSEFLFNTFYIPNKL